MYEYITKLEDEVLSANGEEKENVAFCSGIAQIRFNAWHYIDANLWASLVAKIFDDLAEKLSGNEDKERIRINLLENLETAKELRAKAKAELEISQKTIQEKEKAIVDFGRIKDFTERLFKNDTFISVLGNIEIPKKTLSDINNALNRVGEKNEIKDANDLISIIAQGGESAVEIVSKIDVLLKKTTQFLPAIKRNIKLFCESLHGKEPLYLILLAIVATSIWKLPFLIQTMNIKIELVKSLIIQKATVAITAAGYFCDIAIKYGNTSNRRKAEMRKNQQTITSELEIRKNFAVSAFEAAKQQERCAKQELNDIKSGRILSKFIEERSEKSIYKDELGIISLIREDFKNLEKHIEQATNKACEIDKEKSESNKNKEETSTQNDECHKKIDRIVLYIDDLDRCPPKRVVEVLQAVHLLLAFDLFVVVVAVDSRWVLRALEDHYPTLLTVPNNQNGDSAEKRASSPHNYLEKIFNIPYRISYLREDGYYSLINSLTENSVSLEDILIGTTSGDFVNEPEKTTPDYDVAEQVETENRKQEDVAIKDIELEAAKIEQRTELEQIEEKINLNPKQLMLKQDEVDFIKALYPIVKTPRSAKRLVNVYQIVRATLKDDEMDIFEDSFNDTGKLKCGCFREMILMLAINLNFPSLTPILWDELKKEPDDNNWWRFCSGFKPEQDNLAAGTKMKGRTSDNMNSSEVDEWNDFCDRIAALGRSLDSYAKSHKCYKDNDDFTDFKPNVFFTLDNLKSSLPRIMRFSF